MMEILIPAIRQFRHNDNSGLLIAYDKDEVNAILSGFPVAIYQYRYRAGSNEWSMWRDCCSDKYKSIKKDLLDGSYEARELIVKSW